ncbi:hypothetical protein Ddye_003243 [Dipteronia dyeriana]|uniref:Transposase MuDR plant domain-containing protein n=1 Tax=Dipteronia dyeriana TaxID=168575 RepID=A0AAD9XRX6_9ROSI|nr:hypothetical protein Ddye_003243 [Dipteronia dyeriana]
MDKVRFVVLYDGEWIESGGKFKYQSGKSRLILVSRETSYESLEDIIYGLIKVNPNEFSIKMKYLFNSAEVLAPFEVMNDDDVEMFLCENSVVKTRTLLCVTTKRKTRIMPNTQCHDNERVDDDIANVLESDNLNGVGLIYMKEYSVQMNLRMLMYFQLGGTMKMKLKFKVNKFTKALLVLTCRVEDCKWRVRATKLNGCE